MKKVRREIREKGRIDNKRRYKKRRERGKEVEKRRRKR
jgi:hypothetical protein